MILARGRFIKYLYLEWVFHVVFGNRMFYCREMLFRRLLDHFFDVLLSVISLMSSVGIVISTSLRSRLPRNTPTRRVPLWQSKTCG